MEIVKILLKGLVSGIIFTLVLFLCAGRANYMQGWIFFITNIITTIMYALAYPKGYGLAEERSKVKADAKSWDKKLLSVSALVYLLTIITAGLDSGRFRWSPEFDWPVYSTGILLMVGGQTIFIAALRENKFFSSIVRIQKDRGHVVCDTGIYKIVRHPGYLGMMLTLLGIPFVTGSAWSLIPTAIAVILLFIRTSLEDKTLKAELEGYEAYTRKTRKKLIPWVW